ncbi:hypothetical protein TWF694_000944 [Orbilia ellipsospora]|uniref:Uncharacterized protein n=1 Tax=Orbilia ellipsospora TaxID=2528407 RepID=A0AAV9XRL6_9PEZI
MHEELRASFARATNILIDHGINLIEWGDQVLQSWGYPAVISVYDYVIEDSHLEEATSLLENPDTGFTRVEPSRAAKSQGVLAEGGCHFVSKFDKKTFPTRIHLVPESLVYLSSHDAEHVHSPFDPSHGVFRPKLPQHCISLVKCMADYAVNSVNRLPASQNLSILLVTVVYKYPNPGGKMFTPEEEDESEEEFLARQHAAIQEVEGWDLAEKDEPYRSKLIKYMLTNSIS